MTEKNQNQMDTEKDASYVYRWNYGEQCAHDAWEKKQKRRNGVIVYAIVMTAVFLLCFAMLAGALVWYGSEGPIEEESTEEQPEEKVEMSVGDVAEIVNPATVLIYAANDTAYAHGTGFFLREDGYIATNYHVLEGRDYYSVTLYNGKELEAKLVGFSEADDLAVLKIAGMGYPVLAAGDSDKLRVGDVAIAVGNPSGPDASWTTTQGIISALNREVTLEGEVSIETMTMIQTDAALNPGNSGGPLCNDRAEVIGVITLKLNDNEGISFAIPINGAMEILNAIIKDGNANNVNSSVSKVRPTMGITGGTIQKGDAYTYGGTEYKAGRSGVIVSSVNAKGAARGVLRVADIIIGLEGKTITTMEELIDLLYTFKVGDTVAVTVWRDGRELTVLLTLGAAN